LESRWAAPMPCMLAVGPARRHGTHVPVAGGNSHSPTVGGGPAPRRATPARRRDGTRGAATARAPHVGAALRPRRDGTRRTMAGACRRPCLDLPPGSTPPLAGRESGRRTPDPAARAPAAITRCLAAVLTRTRTRDPDDLPGGSRTGTRGPSSHPCREPPPVPARSRPASRGADTTPSPPPWSRHGSGPGHPAAGHPRPPAVV
jgi:hypothetical protein